MGTFYILLLVTFFSFFVEALINFNIGINGASKKSLNPKRSHKTFKFPWGVLHIHDMDEFLTITIILIMFAGINAVVANYFMRKAVHNVYF